MLQTIPFSQTKKKHYYYAQYIFQIKLRKGSHFILFGYLV